MRAVNRLPLKIALAVVLLYALIFACQEQQNDQSAAEQAVRAAVHSYVEIFNTNNTEMIAAVIDSSFVCYHPGYPDNIVGLAGFGEWLEMNHTAFPDLLLAEDETVIEGDRAFVRWTFSGTHTGPLRDVPPTGRKLRLSGLSFLRIQNGKVVEERIGMDLLGAYRQLGFTLMPPSEKT